MNYTIIQQTISLPFRRYPVESILIVLASIITLYTLIPHVVAARTDESFAIITPPPQAERNTFRDTSREKSTIAVEVSGAVLYPDVYVIPSGSRIKDVISSAGGLSPEADSLFVARNFNMARAVADTEKIYVPYTWDIAQGTFVEEKRILSYLDTPLSAVSTDGQDMKQSSSADALVSINTASRDELDTLPGIGPTTAQKIIDNRPYTRIEELLENRILKQTVYESLSSMISL